MTTYTSDIEEANDNTVRKARVNASVRRDEAGSILGSLRRQQPACRGSADA